MEKKTSKLWDHRLWVEGFVLVNLAFLGPDIYLAHSVNDFRHPAEYVPLYFSLAAPIVLLVALIGWLAWSLDRLWVVAGHAVGWASVAIGVVGLVFHLESHFFHERTLASLVYAAPFAAPLAYTGVGLLLVMNRMVDAESMEWPLWVLFLALGGFVGNFIFSVTDHAQNGFYHPAEWIPVISSALAVGFLLGPFLLPVRRSYLLPCAVVLALQAGVGLLGFYYHNRANLQGPSPSMWDNFIDGAPVLAPLLFPNLVLLALIGLWVYRRHLPMDRVPSPALPSDTPSSLTA
jgi:hypothetical protein